MLLVSLPLLAACGGSTDESGLAPAEVRGKQIARSAGCSSCHGAEGQGGLGPSWVGIEGTERQLADGRVVIADEAYLIRSIRDPQADLVAGWNVKMPGNNLSDDQIQDLLAFMRSTGSDPSTSTDAG